MRKRLWDLAKSRIEIATILPGHRHKVTLYLTPIVPQCAPGSRQAEHRSHTSHIREDAAHK